MTDSIFNSLMPPKRVYIAENLAAQLSLVYPGKESGLNRAVGGFLALRELSLRQVRGIFTAPELVGLVDAFNGVWLGLPHPLNPQQMLRFEMEDANELEDNASRHGYDADVLQAKIAALTQPESFFLLDELERFWNTEEAGTTPDLNSFLAMYAIK